MPPSGYNPTQYWLSRGKAYREQFRYDPEKWLQEEALLDYLKAMSPFPAVLEVGCGFGRISKLILSNFPDIQEYVAADLSPDQLANARDYVQSDKIRFIESDIQSLDFSGRKFDLVIGVSVLLHVLPSDIDRVISRLVSMSKKHVVNVDYYEEEGRARLAEHNFLHDYGTIYKGNRSVVSVKRIPVVKKTETSVLDARQSIFHATVAANR